MRLMPLGKQFATNLSWLCYAVTQAPSDKPATHTVCGHAQMKGVLLGSLPITMLREAKDMTARSFAKMIELQPPARSLFRRHI